MLSSLNAIDILIGRCNFELGRAEDRHDLDTFNFWFAERERLYRERSNFLCLSLGGV